MSERPLAVVVQNPSGVPAPPDAASFAEGACLGIPAMTAHRCVYADGPVAGNTLLITGGAGRVGAYAIQWAVESGARVITTASNQEDANLCRALGAVAVCNHREVGWAREVSNANSGQPVDRVVDVEPQLKMRKDVAYGTGRDPIA